MPHGKYNSLILYQSISVYYTTALPSLIGEMMSMLSSCSYLGEGSADDVFSFRLSLEAFMLSGISELGSLGSLVDEEIDDDDDFFCELAVLDDLLVGPFALTSQAEKGYQNHMMYKNPPTNIKLL